MTIPIIRKRAKRPKTHTGCITCRARHIKCDEDKPACRRCTRSGRICEGYTEPRRPKCRRTPVLVLPKPNLDSAAVVHLALAPALSPFAWDLSAAECKAFEFFRLETAHQLPGNSWTLSWPQLALQVGPHEPAVVHIAIALGALHRARHWAIRRSCPGLQVIGFGEWKDGSYDFAHLQYGKALRHLRTYIANLSPDVEDAQVGVVLLVVLLLFCFEVWSADDVRAGVHLRTGLQILYKWHSSRGRIDESHGKSSVMLDVRPRDQMGVLVRSFVRLDADISIVYKGNPCLRPVVREPIPEAFVALEDAMVHLDVLCTSVQDVYAAMTDVAMAELRQDSCIDTTAATTRCLADAMARTVDLDSNPGLIDRMTDIRRNVRQFMCAVAFVPVKVEEEAAHLLVQIQLFNLWLDTSTWRDADEMHSDKYQEQFEHILSLAQRYIKLAQEPRSAESSASSTMTSDSRPVISLGTGLVAGLCMILFRCRNSMIRRRCIQSMREINLQGVFDTDYLVSFAKAVVDVEETRARALLDRTDRDDLQCHEIPAEARLLDLDLGGRVEQEIFYKDDFGYLVYVTRDANGILKADTARFKVERCLQIGLSSTQGEDDVQSN